MARMVRRDATGPIKIEAPAAAGGDPAKPIFICACGLSQKFPFCDGAHKSARVSEEPGKLYIYGPDNTTVVEVREEPKPPNPGTAQDPRA